MRPGTRVRVYRKTPCVLNRRTGTVGPLSHFAGDVGIVAEGDPAPGWEVPVYIDGVKVSFLARELAVAEWGED